MSATRLAAGARVDPSPQEHGRTLGQRAADPTGDAEVPVYAGLTWDHPRGYAALDHLAQADGSLRLHWDRHSLEGFEASPIGELAERYDLIVLDHPHVGDALAEDCLVPLDELFCREALAAWSAQSIGATAASYVYGGRAWALPLDAATQVAVAHPGLPAEETPQTWADVIALAGRRRICLSLAGPHAVLSFFSIAAAHGDTPARPDPAQLFAGAGAEQAWAMLRELHALADPALAGCNPIGILHAMRTQGAADYCPLVYGYVNYALPRGEGVPLRFAEAPAGPAGRGSTLGGTGVAVSRRASITPALKAHLATLMSLQAQCRDIPAHAGQPSARVAWADAAIDAAAGGFYGATRGTIEAACVRPRHAGYIAFQTAAADVVRAALDARWAASRLLDTLQSLHERHRPPGAEA